MSNSPSAAQRIDALTFVMARAVAAHVVDFDGLPCSINISPLSLERLEFADQIARGDHASRVWPASSSSSK